MHIIHALFTSEKGGLEQSFIDTTRALAAGGNQITCLVRRDAPYRAELTPYGDIFTVTPTCGFYDVLTIWKIHRLFKRLRPEFIVAHNARATVLMSYAARGLGIPVCAVSHSYKTHRIMHADALVVLTGHMRQHFEQAGYPAHKIHVIPNLIEPVSAGTARPYRTPVVMGAMGRFTEEKGFQDFLLALKQVNGEFVVRIAGDGPQKRELQALAQGLNIEWMGWVSDKAEFYRSIDLLCVPSREESFGMVVLEALAAGVPVVSTDAHGPASILTHQKNALVVPRGDTAAMAAALSELVANPALATALRNEGLKRAEDFTLQAVTARWNALATKLASAKLRQAA